MQRMSVSAWLVSMKFPGGRGKALKDLRFLQLIVLMGEWEMGEVLCPCSPFPPSGKGPILHIEGTRLPHVHCSHCIMFQTVDAKERGASGGRAAIPASSCQCEPLLEPVFPFSPH